MKKAPPEISQSSNTPKRLKKLKGFKEGLATKICSSCNRPFQYRKKWKSCWELVKYCSQKCRLKS